VISTSRFFLGVARSLFVDALDAEAPSERWRSIGVHESWGACHRAAELLRIYDDLKEGGFSAGQKNETPITRATLYNRYYRCIGWTCGLDEELGAKMTASIEAEFSKHLVDWRRTLDLCERYGVSTDGDEDPLTAEELCFRRDFLEWTWRGCLLAQQEDASLLPGLDVEAMRRSARAFDVDLRKLLGDQRFPQTFVHDDMWWRHPGHEPSVGEAR
jgi:hypothetical protein